MTDAGVAVDTPGPTPSVLWYVHDVGSGHLARARAVIPHLSCPVVVAVGPGQARQAVRTLPCPVVALPSDVPDRAVATVGPWHHAPSDRAVRRRAAALARAVEDFGCTTAVVDVSAEVVVLARLLGLRVVAVRQSGRRNDPTHRLAHATADRVWVPQHRVLERHVDDADDRWCFTGAFSRFDACPSPRRRPASARRHLVVAVGAGGTDFDDRAWRTASLPPGWTATIAGSSACWTQPSGSTVASVGVVDDFGALLASADAVLTSAGWGTVADVAWARVPLVVVPEARPFDEQQVRARALEAAGLAVVLPRWPAPGELGPVLDAAGALDVSRWDEVHDGGGAQRAAALIDGVHRG